MNSIRGVGCDIVSVSRIARLLRETRFLSSVCTEREQMYCKDKSAGTVAGLWAAKEAVSKALGTGFSGFTAKDIEVCHDEYGQPFAVLHNGAKREAAEHNVERIHLSISHEKEQAIAFAVAE